MLRSVRVYYAGADVQNSGTSWFWQKDSGTKVVQIRFQGACIGCPSSEMTLKMGIEENLKAHVPEITGVMAVD